MAELRVVYHDGRIEIRGEYQDMGQALADAQAYRHEVGVREVLVILPDGRVAIRVASSKGALPKTE